jgi:hypothetical protein
LWTESFTCNVCGKPRGDASDWWIAWADDIQPHDQEDPKPKWQIMPWSELMARSREATHLCGLACALKEAEKWLSQTGNEIKRREFKAAR